MKQTSIRAYHSLKESGQLTRLQRKVLEAFRNHGPMTGSQVSKLVPGGWKRISELCSMGVLDRGLDKVYDSATHQSVYEYTTTGQEPMLKNPAKRKPSAKALQMLIDKMAQGKDISALYAKAYEQGYKDAKSGYALPEEL